MCFRFVFDCPGVDDPEWSWTAPPYFLDLVMAAAAAAAVMMLSVVNAGGGCFLDLVMAAASAVMMLSAVNAGGGLRLSHLSILGARQSGLSVLVHFAMYFVT